MPRAPSRARGTDPNAATGGHVKARPITERQLEVLRIVARGRTNREIGLVLGISERTVRNHMREILRRLSTRDRTHSVVVAIGSGWIAIPVEPDDSAAMPVGTPSTAEVPSGS